MTDEHNYAQTEPQLTRKKLDLALKSLAKYKKLWDKERKISNHRKQKSSQIKTVLRDLKRKCLLDAKGKEHLDVLLSPTLTLLLKHAKANSIQGTSVAEYPPELQVFATTLQFYSTKAYNYVRRTFLKALPHVATIQKWFSNLNSGPGFSTHAFEMLEEKVEKLRKEGQQTIVSVMLDEMSLRKQIDFDDKTSQFICFVDIGNGVVDDNAPAASEVLALMCVGVNSHFKILLGYFFVNGLSGAEKANLVRVTFQKIHDTGARGISLTCDGPSAHFAMLRELGASLDPENLRPFFSHPTDSSLNIYIFLDLVHMLKLVRNTLGSEKVLFSTSGPNVIKLFLFVIYEFL